MARSDRLAVRATLRAWNQRTRRDRGDIAYLVYASVLVGLIVLVPIFRAGWLLLSEPAALAVLASPEFGVYVVTAALVLMAAVCAPWATPVVRRAFLARVFSDAEPRFSVSFAGPVVRWWLVVTALGVSVAALCQGVLWSAGLSDAMTFACVVVSTLAAAAIAASLAVLVQTSTRLANVVSFALVGTGVIIVVAVPPVTALASPVGAGALGVLALVGVGLIPAMLNRLRPVAIVAASLRRDATIVGFTLMDSGVVADAVHQEPRGGRRVWAVPRAPMWLSFAISSAVGAIRTPDRLVRGVVVLMAGLALAAVAPSAWSVTAGAALAYVGIGACMAGVEQAAHAARTTPVYGVSDAALIAMHVVFPAFVAVAASTVGFVGGTSGYLVSVMVGCAALFARVFAALTPPTPLELLMPMPTPAGDAAALLRLGWALQGAIAAVALSVAMLPSVLGSDPWRFVWAPGMAIALLVLRWRTRS